MTRTWLGIDAGTSVVKAAIFDDAGEALAVAGRPLELVHAADDGVEQDLDAIATAVAEVAREVTDGRTPHVVAITGQGDGCWVTDEYGQGRAARALVAGRPGGRDPRSLERRRGDRAGVPRQRHHDLPRRSRAAARLARRERAGRARQGHHRGRLQGRPVHPPHR